jgi:spermidine synthase
MPRRLYLAAAVFTLSGAAALMDQVVWLRYLSLVFGNTTYAAATLLAVFMAGLGAGALVAGRLADRWPRPLLRLALFELSIAGFAVVSPHFFVLMGDAYVGLYRSLGNHPAGFVLARALLAAFFLLPPTFLMGGTFPILLRGVSKWQACGVGRPAALLYATNTLGAVAGTALAGFFSVRVFGLIATLWLAAGCNVAAALSFALLSRPARSAESVALEPARIARWMLLLVAVMGATSLAYEVLWTRILLHYLGSSVYAYSLMLVMFLFGIGAGSLLATPWIERIRDPLAALARIELGIGSLCLLQTLSFQLLNPLRVYLAQVIGAEAFAGACLVELVALLPVLGPPTFLMGMSFPLAIRLVSADPRQRGRDAGAVYGANTIGSVLGSLVAGFALIPLLGTQSSLVAVAALNLAVGAVLLHRGHGPSLESRAAWVLSAAALLAPLLLPPNSVIFAARALIGDTTGSVVYFEESANASVTVRRVPTKDGAYHSLEVNGVNVAGTHPSLYAVQKMQGHLPLLLTPGARSVLHIGFGSGGTAYAVSRHRVHEIVIAELTPEVLAASDRFFSHINHGVLADKRVHVELNDGRNFLMATPRHFDVILSDSVHPHYAGNGSLYSREYFALARDHLTSNGTVSMWLPMYSLTTKNYAMIMRAFHDVFPYTVIWYEPSVLNSFTIVTGRLTPPGPWPRRQPLGPPRAQAELADLGIEGPADLIACYLAGGPALAGWLEAYAPHVDDRPAVEYESGMLLDRDAPWLSTFEALIALRPGDPPAELLAGLTAAEQLRTKQVWLERSERLEAQREELRVRVGHPRVSRAPE